MKKVKKFVRRVLRTMRLEEMKILPGQLAFFFTLSIFSILPLIGLIGSNFVNSELIRTFKETMPGAVYTIFESLMLHDTSGFSITLFVIISLYISSNGCYAMIITSNVIYKVKNNSFIKQQIKSILMTIVLITLILFTVLVPAFGKLILTLIQEHFPGKLINTIINVYEWIKVPISLFIIFFGIKILYTVAPDERIPSNNNNIGSMFTTIGWLVITKIYSTYLSQINTYNIFYGSLANVVILLFWFYLLAYVFVMGMALNEEYYHSSQLSVNENEKKD